MLCLNAKLCLASMRESERHTTMSTLFLPTTVRPKRTRFSRMPGSRVSVRSNCNGYQDHPITADPEFHWTATHLSPPSSLTPPPLPILCSIIYLMLTLNYLMRGHRLLPLERTHIETRHQHCCKSLDAMTTQICWFSTTTRPFLRLFQRHPSTMYKC
jgi:hypothetical protein